MYIYQHGVRELVLWQYWPTLTIIATSHSLTVLSQHFGHSDRLQNEVGKAARQTLKQL